MPSPRRLFLIAFVAVAGCDIGIPISMSDGITAPIESMYVVRSVEITPLNGSGIMGGVMISGWNQTMPLIGGAFWFPNLGPQQAGAEYLMHIHQGRDCKGVDVPIAHDLGVRLSVSDSVRPFPLVEIPGGALPAEHLQSGYYFDVHAANDPTGAPMGCAIFPW